MSKRPRCPKRNCRSRKVDWRIDVILSGVFYTPGGGRMQLKSPGPTIYHSCPRCGHQWSRPRVSS